jgi:Phage P22-like portal protein
VPKAPTPKEIRDRYSDYMNEWREIYEEAKVDMRYVAGDPWDPEDRRSREDAGRPCISLDEINQYLNQYTNSLRQNKRAIEVTPKGEGANDKDATRRANIIRGIEDRSNAQEAYITAGENAVERSYGFAALKTRYAADDGFEQEIWIERIANPDSVLLNPGYKKADASDVTDAFRTDLLTKDDFKRKYPKAKKTNWSGQYQTDFAPWIRENYVQVAEYWMTHKKFRELLLIQSPTGPMAIYEDEMRDFLESIGEKNRAQIEILKRRDVELAEVTQYLTNGIEILDETDWAGTRIPILACFGKELWMDDGSGARRKLMSMVRLARDPQMLHAYYCSQEAEEAGMSPKVPFVGYKGQFESDREAWEDISRIPRSFIQIDAVTDATGQATLPPPVRPQFEPNFQQYEIAKESVRRSIQAAIGGAPLPTDAQRLNEKSGIALEKIQTAQAIGSFHFSDNFDRFLHNMGWQVNELIDKIYDTARTVPVTREDGTHGTLRINDPAYEVQHRDDEGADHYHIVDEDGQAKADFDVTISTGPSYQSQREQASEFVDMLLANLNKLPIPPPIATKILAKAVRMKDLGATGSDIADLLDPPDQNTLPPQAQAIVAQLQGQVQQLSEENQALHMDRAGRVLEQQTKMALENMKQNNENLRAQLTNDIKVLIAEISAKNQSESERLQMYKEFWLENHGAAHEVALQGMDQEHQQGMADKQAAIAAQQAENSNAASQPGSAPA